MVALNWTRKGEQITSTNDDGEVFLVAAIWDRWGEKLGYILTWIDAGQPFIFPRPFETEDGAKAHAARLSAPAMEIA